MGLVASALWTDGGVKVVIVRKGRGKLLLKEVLSLSPEELSFKNLYLSCFSTELVVEKVKVPPVRDEETKEILIKKRLSEVAGVGGNYLMVYEEVPEERSERERTYRVFAFPEIDLNVPPDNLELLTLLNFSLVGVSDKVSPDLVVLHAYSDGEVLVTTASRGKEVLYTRSVKVPPYAKGDEDSYADFLHENVSMTHMFVAQRSNIPVDLLILSGLAAKSERLSASLHQAVNTPIASVTPPEGVRGVEPEVFVELVPLFGTLYLDERFDFSPKDIKEKRMLRRALSKMNPILLLLFFLSGILLDMEIYAIQKEAEDLSRQTALLSSKAISKDPFLQKENLDYYITYINMLGRSSKENPLRLLPLIREFLQDQDVKAFDFVSKDGKLLALLNIEKGFENLMDMTVYREGLIRRLDELRKKGINYRIESENRDTENLRLSITLLLESKI